MIRRATADDYEAIEALSQAIWKDDDELTNRPSGWNRRLWTVRNHMTSEGIPGETTLVAEVDGRVVAAGTIVFQPQQPRHHLYLHVAPGYRDRTLGEGLFAALDGAHRAGPYMTREFGDPEAVTMFESLGFRVVERVTEGRIDPARTETTAWIDGVLATLPDGLEVVALGDQRRATPLEVARLFNRGFQRSHAWIPTPPHSDEEALELFVGNLDAKFVPTLCLFAGDWLIGAVTLGSPTNAQGGRPFAEDSGAYLGWLAVEDAEPADATGAAEILVARALAEVRRHGLDVQVEGPDNNAPLHACLWSIPGADLEEGLTVMISDPPA